VVLFGVENPAVVTKKKVKLFITIWGIPLTRRNVLRGKWSFPTATSNHILIDMTTSTPTLAVKSYIKKRGKKRNIPD